MSERGTTLLPLLLITALGSLVMYRTYGEIYAGIQLRQSVLRDQKLALVSTNSYLRDVAGVLVDSTGCANINGAYICFKNFSSDNPAFMFNGLFEGADSCAVPVPITSTEIPQLTEIFSATTCNVVTGKESFFTTRSNIHLDFLPLGKEKLLIASGGTVKIFGNLEVSGSVHIFAMGSVHIDTIRIPAGEIVTIFSLREITIGAIEGGGTLKKVRPGESGSLQAVLPWLITKERLLWSKRPV